MYRFFFIIALLISSNLHAQVDTKFWFVAPEVSNDHGDDPIYLNISTFDEVANITVSMPANEADFPVITRTIPANDFLQLNLTSFLDEIEHKYRTDYDASIPGKSDQGLLIESDVDITVYYESAYGNNSDLFALKGKNALGSEFYTPFQTRYYNNSGNNWDDPAYSAFDIVFTEDDTYITLDIPAGKAVYNGNPGGWTGTVRLGPFHRGETFSGIPEWISTHRPFRNANDNFGRVAEDHLAGVHIKAHDISGNRLKRIAITIKDDSMRGFRGTAYDLGGDQIVPLDIIGKEYIAMKGQLRQGNVEGHYSRPPAPWWARQEVIFILATEDGTTVSVEGNYQTTLDAGETYTHELINGFTHVEASNPVYLWQVTGFGDEMGAAILPAIDRCTGSDKVAFSRSVTGWSFYMNVLVRTGAEGGFTLNGSTSNLLEANDFDDVTGTSEWKAARIGPVNTASIPELQQSILENSDDVFHLGIIMGNSTGCRFGFFSGFGDIPSIEYNPLIAEQGLCAGNLELSVIDAGAFATYQWYKDNIAIPGETNPDYLVSEPGRYKVTAITTCGGNDTETFPSNEIDALPCLSVADATATEGDPNAVFTVNISHSLPLTNVQFEYETFEISASRGDDYVYTRGTATLPAGSNSVTINVPLKQDFINEPTEQFGLIIRNTSLVNIGDSIGICSLIDDNDPEPEITIPSTQNIAENISGGQLTLPVTLSEISGYTVSAIYTITNGTAIETEDFTAATLTDTVFFAPGETSKDIVVDIVNDDIYEPAALGYETFTISLSELTHCTAGNLSSEIRITDDEAVPSLSINNPSATEGDSLVLNLQLNRLVSENTYVDITINDGTAEQGSDFIFTPTNQTITILAGTMDTSIFIPVLTDIISEGVETFNIVFSNPVNATLSTDPQTITCTLLDDTGTPQIYIDDATSLEGSDLEFTVHLSIASSADINFEYFTTDGTANSPADFTGVETPINHTIAAGDLETTIAIATVQDTEEEADENFTLTLQNISGDAAFTDSTAVGTIEDDDETPVANDDVYSVNEDPSTPLTGNVTDNDNGLGDTPVITSLIQDVAYGTLVLNANGTFTYTPDADFHGKDTFNYRITDADADFDEAMVVITINPVNDVPVANDDSPGSINERTHPMYSSLTGNVLTNDTGLGDGITIILDDAPDKGSLTLNQDGSFEFIPDAQEYGNDQFSYHLRDTDNELSDVATVTFTIAYYNDAAPVATDDNFSTPEDSSITLNVLANDSDIDGDETINESSIQTTPPSNGSLSMDINTGLITYTPDAGFSGDDSFTYTVADRLIGGEATRRSNSATVTITVTSDNSAPIAVCQDVDVYLNDSGAAEVNARSLDDGSSDADIEDILSFSVGGDTLLTFDCGDIGSQEVTLTVSDDNLAQSTCSATINIYDTISPVVTSCTADTVVFCAPSAPGRSVTYIPPSFSDNCGGTGLTGSLISGQPSGSSFSVGATNVQYSYTDPSGNDPAVCSFIVEVIRDTELPVITGNNDTLLPVNQTNNTHVVSGAFLNPEATDNAGVSSLTHDYNGGGTSLNGFTFSLGEHTITWTATDNFGNTSQFIQTVEITERFPVTLISDKPGDEICEGDNITFTATPGTGGLAPYTYTFYIDGTDITGATNEAIYTTSTLSDAQEVKVIATDGAGFTSENSITVSVLPLLENQSIYRRPNN